MLANPWLIVADSTRCKQHSISIFSPHAVSKYLCSLLWCAFSRVRTGTLSWLEGTLHALQRINIRTRMSRATRMLHTMATTAAVDSPVESSRSHSCIADTETASLGSAVSPRRHCSDLWPVKLSASKPYLLMSPSLCCHYYLSPRGPLDRLILCEQVRPTFHISYVHRSRRDCFSVGGRLWNWSDDGSRVKPEVVFGLKNSYFKRLYIAVIRLWTYVFLALLFDSTLFCEVGGNAKQSGFLLDEILDVITIIHLRLSFLSEREKI